MIFLPEFALFSRSRSCEIDVMTGLVKVLPLPEHARVIFSCWSYIVLGAVRINHAPWT